MNDGRFVAFFIFGGVEPVCGGGGSGTPNGLTKLGDGGEPCCCCCCCNIIAAVARLPGKKGKEAAVVEPRESAVGLRPGGKVGGGKEGNGKPFGGSMKGGKFAAVASAVAVEAEAFEFLLF